jgi:hypothetical protein
MSENSNSVSESNVQLELRTLEIVQEEKKSTLDLVQLLSSKIIGKEVGEIVNSFTFPINSTVISIVKRILEKSPESLNKITVSVKDILADGVIDQKDIPKMLVLVTNLYKTDFSKILLDITFTSSDIIELIKFLIKTVIEFDLVKVENKKNAFEMIDVSGELLELVLPDNQIKVTELVESAKGCFSCCFPKKNK